MTPKPAARISLDVGQNIRYSSRRLLSLAVSLSSAWGFIMRNLCAMIVLALGAATASAADWLIYTDQSPGSLAFQAVIQRQATVEGKSLTLKTDPNEFSTAISSDGPWQRVFVAAKFTAGSPPYAAALTTYATGGGLVEMYFWHHSGAAPAGNTAVLATTAITLWHKNLTTIKYALAETDVPAAASGGYAFPNFSGVSLKNPSVIATAPEGTANVIEFLLNRLQTGNGQDDCLTKRQQRVSARESDYAEHLAECDSLYPNNPQERTACYARGSTNLSNSISAAMNRYNNCIALCNAGGSN